MEFKFTPYNKFKKNGMTHCLVSFTSDQDIQCNPPFKKSEADSRWIKYKAIPKSQTELEKCIGLTIQSWE